MIVAGHNAAVPKLDLVPGKDVPDYQTAADGVRSKAMSPVDSAGLIARLVDEMEGTTC